MKTDAYTVLELAADAIDNRAAERDTKKERSMKRAVDIFNAYSGVGMTEHLGWMFMVCLKMARARAGDHRLDDYIDLAGYAGLAAESLDFKHYDGMNEDDEEIAIDFVPELPSDVDSNPLNNLPVKEKGPERKWDTNKYVSKTYSNSSTSGSSSSQPTATKSAPASSGGTSSPGSIQVKSTSPGSSKTSTPAVGASSPAKGQASQPSTSTSPSTTSTSPKNSATSKPQAAAGTTSSNGKKGTGGASA